MTAETAAPDKRVEQAKALACRARLAVLEWLRAPRLHFGHQKSGDPEVIGVCVTLITEKLAMSQPTVTRHLDILRRAGFLTVTRRGRWAFYARNDAEIERYRGWLADHI